MYERLIWRKHTIHMHKRLRMLRWMLTSCDVSMDEHMAKRGGFVNKSYENI